MLVPILIGILIFVLLLNFWSLQKNPDNNVVKSFWQKFETMFIEDTEDNFWSSNRFSYVFTMILSNIIMWGAVIFLVITTSAFPEIPGGIIMIYGISNGVASAAKVWQKREERFMQQLENGQDTKDKN